MKERQLSKVEYEIAVKDSGCLVKLSFTLNKTKQNSTDIVKIFIKLIDKPF